MNSKYYKLTLARIGKQESWAGWKIAGKSEDTPIQVMESFESYHSTKNHVVSTMNTPVEVYEIADYKGSLFVSNIRFGIKDMLGRPSFYTKGIVFYLAENPDIYEHPERFLSLTPEDFDFRLKPLYDTQRNLKQEYMSGTNIVTIHDSECGFKRELNLEKIIAKYFPSPQKLERFVRSIFWAGNNTQTTLTIRVPRGFDEFFEIMYLVYSVLPFNMRSSFSCRTYNLRGLSGAKIIFSSDAPIGKFYDLMSGNDNIFIDSNILNNSKKLTFIDYIISHIHTGDNPEYFELLQNSLTTMGQIQNVDLNTIEMAHNMLLNGDKDPGSGDMTDMEILKKYQEYISLDYSNDVVDENIVKYLTLIIDNNIVLNDTLTEKLEKKLAVTQYQPLIDLGYEYKCKKLIESPDRKKSFKFMYSLENGAANQKKYFEYILKNKDGAEFLDEYYSTYYAEETVRNTNDLLSFYQKTKHLPVRKKIDEFIYSMALQWASATVDQLLQKHSDTFSLTEFTKKLTDGLGISPAKAKEITEGMKTKYWNEFDFVKFEYKRINDYLTYLPYHNWQCDFIRHLNDDILKKLVFQNVQSVRLFNSMVNGLNDKRVHFSVMEKKRLINGFKNYCLQNLDKSTALDFWYKLAFLSTDQVNMETVADFLFRNNITVFTNPRYFEKAYAESQIYNDRNNGKDGLKNYTNFKACIKRYVDGHGNYDEIVRIIDSYDKKDDIYSSSSLKRKSDSISRPSGSRFKPEEKSYDKKHDHKDNSKNGFGFKKNGK